MTSGKCPKCDALVDRVLIEPVALKGAPGVTGPAHRVVTYLCPSCNVVLGVVPEPVGKSR